ncbi:MAG: hypothetical protein A3E87_08175 [Gammaproteobacteria bacterium RIFCSPHIGHO2_12_FULL_35_23]|nr:MAG: hypothetical protein A3E87_08175 [Gammaproteobacteria bacterium RIFCSPHIGHO2_12_FULL_35_23]
MKRKSIVKVLMVSSFASLIAACSSLPQKYQFVRNNSNDYRSAAVVPPLSLPPGYSSSKIEDYYVVPNPELARQATPVELLPPDLNSQNIPKEDHWWSS